MILVWYSRLGHDCFSEGVVLTCEMMLLLIEFCLLLVEDRNVLGRGDEFDGMYSKNQW